MKRIRLGVCIADREYGDRFTSYLASHYKEQIELHIFTEAELIWQTGTALEAVLLSGEELLPVDSQTECPIFYLFESEEELPAAEEKGGVYWVEKYQEVNKIVDEIMRHIGEEIQNVRTSGCLPAKTQMLAVYSLSENEYQLPLAVTLASILSEKERVLLLDLQENSGFSQLIDGTSDIGLEELLVMIEGGKYSRNCIVSGIGHLEQADFVYPAENTECLCEMSSDTYQRLIQTLVQEMGYGTVILNLGSRFAGFFDLLGKCREIYLMKGRGGLSQWRQNEFMAELEKHDGAKATCIREIEVPLLTGPVVTCERLVEQWKWNEFGDSIRRMVPGVMNCG